MMDPSGGKNVLYVGYINTHILVMILNYSFIGYHSWRKLGKGYMGSLHYFLQLCVNVPLSQNRNFNLKINVRFPFSRFYFPETTLSANNHSCQEPIKEVDAL